MKITHWKFINRQMERKTSLKYKKLQKIKDLAKIVI